METGHAAMLTRHQSGWMTYENDTLRLAWLGFSDAHSDVTTYYVTVGATMASSDMLVSGHPLRCIYCLLCYRNKQMLTASK